jgi:DNA topoisomerase-1
MSRMQVLASDASALVGGLRIGPAYGPPIRVKQELQRVKAMGIPPAWPEIWICPIAEGHLQATGRDAKWAKQLGYASL